MNKNFTRTNCTSLRGWTRQTRDCAMIVLTCQLLVSDLFVHYVVRQSRQILLDLIKLRAHCAQDSSESKCYGPVLSVTTITVRPLSRDLPPANTRLN